MIWEQLYDGLLDWLKLISDNFISFEKRTSIVYFLPSIFLAFYVYKKLKIKDGFGKYFFSKNVWMGKSARVDYFIILFNAAIKIVIITPMLFVGLWLQMGVNDFLIGSIGKVETEFFPTLLVIGYTVCVWIFNDLGTYLIHLLFHKVPFLWEFHKIHHSATTMTPFTLYRIHPVEIIINNLKRLIVYGLVTGVFYYLASGEVGTITFVGVNIFTFAFMFFGANLRHSHVKLTFPSWLENIFISPFQHQIHHSDDPKHFNKNLGSHLAIWDKLFGTLVKSKETEKVTFGLGKENPNYTGFWKSLWRPFRNLTKSSPAK